MCFYLKHFLVEFIRSTLRLKRLRQINVPSIIGAMAFFVGPVINGLQVVFKYREI